MLATAVVYVNVVADVCTMVPGPVPDVTTIVKGALPPVTVVVITASGDVVQSNVFVTTAAAVNCGYTMIGDAAVIQPFLSLIETV